MKIRAILTAVIFGGAFLVSCGGGDTATEETNDPSSVTETPAADAPIDINAPSTSKGVGAITSITLAAEIDAAMATSGEALFTEKCTACHKMDVKYVGPPLKGVVDRRTPEWIMNMMLNPEKMVAEDPLAKALLATYIAPMANQSLTEEQARAILEYFRTQI